MGLLDSLLGSIRMDDAVRGAHDRAARDAEFSQAEKRLLEAL